ncbi:helix-turn-helix domain-containing protein [Nocardia halotolerans]|uniref:Helix-turn-helix domain-containing protein n=1 Tax=Nocardia halotolerans TaxID=1755878 RepID=A0ABV8VE80_9NOCA
MADTELGAFLRSRRARLQPEAVGLRSYGGRRRVAGLRREELAVLAGVSVPYYVRLEQGRAGNVSSEVLTALARALLLDAAETAHLHDLARPDGRRIGVAAESALDVQVVRPTLRRLLDAMPEVPAFVLGRRTEMLAGNRMAALLFWNQPNSPPSQTNCARSVFLDPAVRTLYRDWPHKARETVGFLRRDAARYPGDVALTALIGELTLRSTEFSVLWAEHEVRQRATGRNVLDHPLVGELVLDYDSVVPADDADQVLITYLPAEGTRTAQALRLLGDWHADTGRLEQVRVTGE